MRIDEALDKFTPYFVGVVLGVVLMMGINTFSHPQIEEPAPGIDCTYFYQTGCYRGCDEFQYMAAEDVNLTEISLCNKGCDKILEDEP